MHGGDAVEREEFAIELFHELFNGSRIAPHHTFVKCVDDEVIDLFVVGQGRPDDFCGPIDNAERPIHGRIAGDFPDFSRGFVFSGQIFGEQR